MKPRPVLVDYGESMRWELRTPPALAEPVQGPTLGGMMATLSATVRRQRTTPAISKAIIIDIPFLEECLDFLARMVGGSNGIKQSHYLLLYKRVEDELALYKVSPENKEQP
jgi:hypothetical protein